MITKRQSASAPTSDAVPQNRLNKLGQILLILLPVLFVAGRAPADIALSLIAVLFLLKSHLDLGWGWLKTPWLIVALTLWVYLITASLLAIDSGASLGRALPFLRFLLFAAALQHWLLPNRQMIERFLTVLAAVLGFVLLDCLYQYGTGIDILGKVAEGEYRLSGPFNNDVVGTFIAKTSLPLLGWWFAWSAGQGRFSWVLGGLLAALIGLVIMLTGERMALATYGLGLLVLVLAVKSIRLPLLIMGLIASIGIGAAIVTQPNLHQRFIGHTGSDLDGFWSGRYGAIFVKAFQVWREAPLTGVGLKNFRNTCKTGNFDHQGPVATWCFNHPHNPYLELLAETGLIGLALFLTMMALLLRTLASGWRRRHADFPLAVGASASLLLFLWPFLISKSLFSNWNAMLLWLMIGLALAITSSVARRSSQSLPGSNDNIV